MDRRRLLAALGFGLLNTGFFVVASGGVGLLIFAAAPWLGAILVALAVVAAGWCLEGVDDLARITARDAAALLVRGSMAGSLVAAIVGGIAFGLDGAAEGLYGAMLAGFLGLFAGLACALLDVVILGGVRFVLARRVVSEEASRR